MPEPVRDQAERILETIRDQPGAELPPDIDVDDVAEVIDADRPFPVNLNRVLEQLATE